MLSAIVVFVVVVFVLLLLVDIVAGWMWLCVFGCISKSIARC
jgi:hypothetical protein